MWTYSLRSTYEEFQAMYPEINVSYKVFTQHCKRIVERFLDTGSVQKGKSGGRPTVATPNVVENVQNVMENNPHLSLRRLSQQTGLSYGSSRTILKKDLKLHPYKCTVVQQLMPPDFPARIRYCNWYNANLQDVAVQNVTFFTDEAWFHLSGYINSQNYRTWSAENPHQYEQVPLHPIKVGVWVAMSRQRIFGPVFFNNTINAERYCNQLLEPFINQLDDLELTNGYFQHDKATAHTARATRNYLEQFFPGRIISTDLWPSRSPDLTPLDFFLFPYLKNTIYKQPLNNLDELRREIVNAISNIGPEMLTNVFANINKRVHCCLEQDGQHFEHLL